MNYYRIFDMAEDECLDILQSSIVPNDLDDIYTANITKKMVLEKINPTPVKNKKLSMKKVIIIAIAAALLVGGSVIAKTYWELWQEGGAVEITDENRGMVGKDIHYETGDFVLTEEEMQELQEQDRMKGLEENEIVKSVEEGGHTPYHVDVFTSTKAETNYVTPEVIMTNDAMAVFTTPDKTGWILKKGDVIQFTVKLYSRESNVVSHFAIVDIVDGEAKKEIQEVHAAEISYQYTAIEDCIYNIGVISASSGTISFQEGTVSIVDN